MKMIVALIPATNLLHQGFLQTAFYVKVLRWLTARVVLVLREVCYINLFYGEGQRCSSIFHWGDSLGVCAKYSTKVGDEGMAAVQENWPYPHILPIEYDWKLQDLKLLLDWCGSRKKLLTLSANPVADLSGGSYVLQSIKLCVMKL